jgi:hypothetical protein
MFNYIIGDKVRGLSMNVAFKYIWLKGFNFLTNGWTIHLYIIYQSLYDNDYHLPKIRYATF